MMKNYLVTIAYDGTDYHGWQVQPNGITVQQTVQDAVEKILGKREKIIGCSRTDAGVHANEFCFNMRTHKDIIPFRFVGGMNAVLPDDIAVKNCQEVDIDFHARYDCKGKEYVYKIWNSPSRNPFCEGRYLHYKKKIDASFLNEQAQQFVGKHDFSSFCASKSSVEDTVRTVEYFSVSSSEEEVIFKVKADGFLYNMVRILAGTILEIGRGNLPSGSMRQILEARDRAAAGPTAPAHGLTLMEIRYPEWEDLWTEK